MIIDTHTHFYDPERPEGVPWPPADNKLLYRRVLPEHFAAVSAPCGVTGTVVVEASAWIEDNQWILDLAAANPIIVGLVGHVDPGPEFAGHIQRFAADPIFRGVRWGGGHFSDDNIEVLRQAVPELLRHDLELDVIVSKQHLPAVGHLAAAFPDLRMVVNHIAHVPINGGGPDAEWTNGVVSLAAHPWVFMKVSAVLEQSTVQPAPSDRSWYEPTLRTLWDTFGEDRLVYGSNWPVCERASDYATAFGVVHDFFAARGDEALDKYLCRNSRAAYKWVER